MLLKKYFFYEESRVDLVIFFIIFNIKIIFVFVFFVQFVNFGGVYIRNIRINKYEVIFNVVGFVN